MTTALIFAGGTGRRMSTHSKPKQFLELHGKPVIIYTLKHFEEHIGVDNIIIVCIESYINELKHLLKLYGIQKVSNIVAGGDTGHESIHIGLKTLQGVCKDDDIILIHDGVRPLINEELITANINKAKKYGTAITIEAATESVVRVGESDLITDVPPRAEMFTAKAPQTFKYKLIIDIYNKAERSKSLTIDSAHLCSIYGIQMHTVKSTPNNIKITNPQDYYIFRALYEAMENQQILGV